MRTEFVTCDTEAEAAELCPWAAVIVPVEGGFRCFESPADYDTWANQV